MTNPHFDDGYWRRQRRFGLRDALNPDQARELSARLKSQPGIEEIRVEDNSLYASYDLREISLRSIKRHIRDTSNALLESRWVKFRDFLIEYREAILRAEKGIDYGWDVWIQDAYVSRYRLRRHGRRDDRITNWRMYERDEEPASSGGSGAHEQT